MASVQKRQTASGVRYDVRYRTPDRKVRTRTFQRKIDAERFARSVEADKDRGDWLDPHKGRRTFADLAGDWLATRSHLKANTVAGYRSILEVHLLPRLGAVPVASIDHAAVLRIVSEMDAAGAKPGTIRNARNVARSILELGVRTGALRSNPAVGAKVPKARRAEMHFLSAEQVADLAEAIANPPRPARHPQRHYPEYGLLVRFAAYTGLRAGEIAALKARRVDLMRRTVDVVESVAEVHGELIYGPTKTYERRTVPLPGALADELAEHLAGAKPDDLVFTAPDGGPLRHSNFYRRHFRPAVERAGLPEGVRFHDLRHTCVALLVAQGAHPLAISKWMGHSSITVTMDTYGHVMPSLTEALTDALDAVYRSAAPTPDASVRAISAR